MNASRRQEPMRFTRGRRQYQIARSYTGEDGFIGICDGQVIARATERAEVARVLIDLSRLAATEASN